MMRNNTVAIDVRPLSRKMSGIRRYTEELLRLLVKDENIKWLLFSDRQIEDNLGLSGKKNIEICVIPKQWGAKFFWPLYSMRWLYRYKPDIYWSPRHHLPLSVPKGTILYLTIHDLVWLEARGTMPIIAYVAEWLWTSGSIRKADIILPVSNTTTRKIKERFKSCKAQIFTISNGYNPPDTSIRPGVLASWFTSSFFLAVGTHEPRKNYANLIAAYEGYLELGGEKALLIVGNRGWGTDIKQLLQKTDKASNHVVLLESINDYELRWCYEHASALVSASLNEGFGIPLIEAQYFGLPVIVSDIEPYREIVGFEAVFFNPLSKESIAKALIESDHLLESSRPEIKSTVYSWEASANKLSKLLISSLRSR